jgi:hypothetical protein
VYPLADGSTTQWLQLILDEILYCFYVVIGSRFCALDGEGVFFGEGLPHSIQLVGCEALGQGEYAVLCQVEEIGYFYPYAVAHKGSFGEVWAQGGYLFAIAAIYGRDGVQGSCVHMAAKIGGWDIA